MSTDGFEANEMHDKDMRFLDEKITRNHNELLEKIGGLTETVRATNGKVQKHDKEIYVLKFASPIIVMLMGIIGTLIGKYVL